MELFVLHHVLVAIIMIQSQDNVKHVYLVALFAQHQLIANNVQRDTISILLSVLVFHYVLIMKFLFISKQLLFIHLVLGYN